jgi:glyoxylase-like metal-dependent hydrolase (beta-lactamase superfamily II)
MGEGIYIQQVETGLMRNFNYLIGDPATHECAYVDPAWEVDRLLKIAKEDGFKITKILLTHNHFDHIEGVEAVVAATGAEVFINKNDDRPLKKGAGKLIPLTNGQELKVGNLIVTALNTPGHTPGSTCYLVKAPDDPLVHLFTGDTLFQGNCGRSDLPGGDPKVLFKSLGELKQLDPATKIYPGHDYGVMPVTTIGYEKQHNPTLKARTFEDFDRLI